MVAVVVEVDAVVAEETEAKNLLAGQAVVVETSVAQQKGIFLPR